MSKLIKPDNNFSYMGRIDFEGDYPLFIYAGSMVKVKFTGTSIGVLIKNFALGAYSSLGAFVDGVQYKTELLNITCVQEHIIAENLEDKEHELIIFKRQGGAHYFEFMGIISDDNGGVSAINEEFKLNIEVYGDSVSAGEVTEAIYHTETHDPDVVYGYYDNSWFSYPLMLARKLEARVHNNSQGGIALLNGTGYFGGENAIGLEETYDKLSYVKYSEQGYKSWDFEKYTPDYVIFAVGQNDHHPDADAINDTIFCERWKAKYKDIVTDLLGKYNNAKFILLTTILFHDEKWDTLLDEIKAELQSKRVHRYNFRRCGKGTPGHPKLAEQEEMAGELYNFIKKLED